MLGEFREEMRYNLCEQITHSTEGGGHSLITNKKPITQKQDIKDGLDHRHRVRETKTKACIIHPCKVLSSTLPQFPLDNISQ